MSELVSCIMATRNRSRFVRQALRCFLRQTYASSELIVVDDGEQPVAELCRGLARVRYVRLRRPTLTGTKLNIGIRQAHGQILQKLDDDDYYHPDFLKMAVAHLRADRRRRLVAWDCFLVLLAGERQARYSGHGWAAGGTLCFSRRLWERANFRDVPVDEDFWFLEDHERRIARICAPEHYLLVRHGGNTWKHLDDESADDSLRRLPVYEKPLERLMDVEDWEFYRSLTAARPASSSKYFRSVRRD